MAKGEIVVDVRGVPECVQAVRAEFAKALRGLADGEHNVVVATRFREVAAAFEAGQPSSAGATDV